MRHALNLDSVNCPALLNWMNWSLNFALVRGFDPVQLRRMSCFFPLVSRECSCPSEAQALRSHKVVSESKKLCTISCTDDGNGIMEAPDELGEVEVLGDMEPDLCKQAIRCAEAGASSVQDYDVAVRALREAWDKIVASRKKVARVSQVDSQVSGNSQGDDFMQSEVDNTPNSISFCDPQQSKARGRPRNSSLKQSVEKTAKSVKCSLCKEPGHDKTSCPRLRSIGGSFGTSGGMMLDPSPSDLRAHNMLGADPSGFSDGILCLSLGDHFDTNGTHGLSSFGPNSFFQITNLTNPRLFNVNEEFSMTGTRTSPGP
ncbi:hypothetical protein H6P81_019774 [Aristolochia fimbriata]|uniref:Uncharacterized protein n=1 Tax=Aristolochia fimbriata TaxID=158543 RepID=A0AAV7DSY3_ARIFI|nr:hypothetical protein H6P81_019774 [Aristolochia fimbriata]